MSDYERKKLEADLARIESELTPKRSASRWSREETAREAAKAAKAASKKLPGNRQGKLFG